jgi:hypothetical protein
VEGRELLAGAALAGPLGDALACQVARMDERDDPIEREMRERRARPALPSGGSWAISASASTKAR